MYKLRVKGSFAAAHHLPDYEGPCSQVHGHTWVVEVEVSAKNVGNGGMVVDFAIVKGVLREVVAKFDHKNLNDLSWFQRVPPTAENVATVLHSLISSRLSGVTAVTVWESDRASVTIERGGGTSHCDAVSRAERGYAAYARFLDSTRT